MRLWQVNVLREAGSSKQTAVVLHGCLMATPIFNIKWGEGWAGRWVGGGPSEEGLRQRLRTPARRITRPLQAPLWTLYCPEIAFRPLRPLGGPRGRCGLQAFAFGHISCKCVLNVDPYVWRVCPMWPQYRWRRRTLRALRTKRSHLDTAVTVRASRNRRASHSSSRYT